MRLRPSMSLLLAALLAGGSLCAVSIAGSTETSAAVAADQNLERDRETAALDFAQSNHPELAALLGRLRDKDRKQFGHAVHDLNVARDRLDRLREKDAEQYELALRAWTLDSRIRLQAARLTMGPDPAVQAKLRILLEDRRQAKLDLLRLERQRTAARLERLDGQIAGLEADPAAAVERDLARLQRDMSETVKTRPARKRPAAQ